VHVPAEEERGIGAEGRGCYEVGPCWAEEELDECGLEDDGKLAFVEHNLLRNLQFALQESR